MAATPLRDDRELEARDLLSLSDRDGLVAFFSQLGYDTSARLVQEPEHLGITAEGPRRPIRRIERIANHESLFEVYLFELASVTLAHTRALARSFRNLAVPSILLVLTSDYDRIDFVLLEKVDPEDSGAGIGRRQVEVRTRTLSLDRRNPGLVALRVLRRFSWTEADAFAQFDKLRAAYAVAEWSEVEFNNRALFSDHFLLHRLPELAEWRDDPKPALREFRELYRGAAGRLATRLESECRAQLLEPALERLGFQVEEKKGARDGRPSADYLLHAGADRTTPLAFALTYRWNRLLDSKDPNDPDSAEENPALSVVNLLEQGVAPWAVVTNGRLWRLYARKSSAKATSFLEIDLEEAASGSNPAPFRYFWQLYRRSAFDPRSETADGSTTERSFLDSLLAGSEAYAKELGEKLKERIFKEVFPHLATGLIESIRRAEGRAADLPDERLAEVYSATLILLYRLLFVLYAESRDLLPQREVRGYFEVSVERLKREIAAVAGDLEDAAPRHLETAYSAESFTLAERLSRLFEVIDRGEPALNIPAYNGGLFHSPQPAEVLDSEGETARFLLRFPIADLYLARAIDLLARGLDDRRQDLQPVDYKSLGVRQLGSIYEGLLEFKVRIAAERLGIAKEKGREIYVRWADMPERDRARAERARRFVDRGDVYLENDKHERKASGSYYTPDPIVKYIVEQAVGPLLRDKLEALRPLFREAQRWREKYRKLADAKGEEASKYEAGPVVVAEWKAALLDPFFDLKILDPAMGSGHFLVEAADFVSDKLIEFLAAFPWNPVTALLAETRREILRSASEQGIEVPKERLTDVNLLRRHVLKRCLYGVDLNPMAVELAKVSLWLHCFTLGAPLSFLDHHLRCGNSLVGVSVEDTQEAIEEQATLFGSRFAGLLLATDLMRQVGELSDVTPQQVADSRRQYDSADSALAPFRRILDVYTSQWFGNERESTGRGRRSGEASETLAVQFLRASESKAFLEAGTDEAARAALAKLPTRYREIAARALEAASEHRFFHWQLEFPEAFYGSSTGATAIHALDNAGFDAVVGNPPYDVLASEELGYDVSQLQGFIRGSELYAPAVKGKQNLYKVFICRSLALAREPGSLSFIVPMALLGDEQSSGVRKLLLHGAALRRIEAFPQKDDPKRRVFEEAKLSTCVFVADHSSSSAPFEARTHPGREIEQTSAVLRLTPADLALFDPENLPIPSCTQEDWELAMKILRAPGVRRLGEVCRAFQGEVNETIDGKSGYVSYNAKDGHRILRGANITLYAIRSASQGEEIFLRTKAFLSGKPESEKAKHHLERRVGWQESSPQNNFRRIIAAPISPGEFCNHKINYIPQGDSTLDLDFLLALLNSAVHDWFFRLTSANAAVSHFQIYLLPVPPAVSPKVVRGCIRIQELECARTLAGRSDRSVLSSISQSIQNEVDAEVASSFGLTADNLKFVKNRLQQML